MSDNNFIKTLKILQEDTSVLTETTKTFNRIMEDGDEIFVGKYPKKVKGEVDSDTIQKVTGVIMKKNGDIWVTENQNPKTDSTKWTLYYKKDRFKGK